MTFNSIIMPVVYILMICLLTFITYEDMRYRRVSVINFPILVTMILVLSHNTRNRDELIVSTLLNITYLLILAGLCALYFYLRRGKYRWFHIIGMGDLLLLLCFTCWLDLFSYVLFLTVGLTLSLLLHLLLGKFYASYREQKTVPLAGFLSFFAIAQALVLLYSDCVI